MTDDQSRRRDALDNLTDALCEDILKAPGEELLAEVAEDYGDRRALAVEFDRIFARVQQDSGRLDAVSRIRRLMGLISNSRIRPEVTPRTIHDVMELRSPRLHEGSAPDRQGLQDMEPIKVAPVPKWAFLRRADPVSSMNFSPSLLPGPDHAKRRMSPRLIAAFALALMFTGAMFFVFLAASKEWGDVEAAARMRLEDPVLKAGKPAITTTRDGVYRQY
jgi:hypothetical protein